MSEFSRPFIPLSSPAFLACAGLFIAALSVHPAAAQPRNAAAHCGDGLRVELDEPNLQEAWSQSGRRPMGRADLERLRREAGARFRSAAGQLCARGTIPPASFRRYARLVVQNGAGATEAGFYGQGRALYFSYVFTEGGSLAFPDAADVREGLRCFVAPRRRDCSLRGD